jgi:hypothetical protein
MEMKDYSKAKSLRKEKTSLDAAYGAHPCRLSAQHPCDGQPCNGDTIFLLKLEPS